MTQQDFTTLTPPGTTPKINSLFDFSAEALGQLKFWLEQSGLNIPVAQILGFTQFTAKVATQITTNETTTSLTYTDLATVGPSLTALPNGSYLVLFSSEARNTTPNDGAVMSLSFNGGAAGDGDAAYTFANLVQTTIGFTVVTLSSGANTIEAKYRADVGGTAEFQRRKLVAFKYANT